MLQPLRKIALFLILLLSFYSSLAQDCETVEYNNSLRRKGVIQERDAQFEQWVKQQIEKEKQLSPNQRIKSAHYKVQVVIHIIHNGEAVGVGSNISDAQATSQIDVLNNDFNRLNSDAVNTPAEFQPLASSLSIEFVLATENPNGGLSSGINRVNGNKSSWTREEDQQLKLLSYWPAENYINIWVCNLVGFRGYAQFPISTIPGIENSSKNRLTDGLVLGYRFFGSSDFGSFNLSAPLDKGRTTTHEMGHFFGLRHIWGDQGDCSGTDYVDDTPPQAGNTTGCPTHPVKQCPDVAPVNKMFQNYLDLSNDNCMNLFTKGQTDRMKIVLESSPRRASLLIPLDADAPEYEFEKIFSPNGDGINDYWRWTNTLKYEGCSLIIFNRFGKPVFEMTSYDNSWDGRSSDGYVLEAGAYYFTLTCDGKKDIKKAVRLIR